MRPHFITGHHGHHVHHFMAVFSEWFTDAGEKFGF